MNIKVIFAVMNTTSAVVKIKPGKIQAFKVFEPMSSAILVQRSTNRAYGSLYAIYIYIYIYFLEEKAVL